MHRAWPWIALLAVGCSLDVERLRHGTDLDAGLDAGADAGRVDAGLVDAGLAEAGMHDVGLDAPFASDTGTDAPLDTGTDAGLAPVDAGHDASPDAYVPPETNCSNGVDDDGDGRIDCLDSDCEGRSAGAGAICMGGAAHETNCTDGIDNDRDGRIDCTGAGDPDCLPTLACGTGCALTGCTPHETRCNDRIDNDHDALTDCADTTDCPVGTACMVSGGGAGTCRSGGSCL